MRAGSAAVVFVLASGAGLTRGTAPAVAAGGDGLVATVDAIAAAALRQGPRAGMSVAVGRGGAVLMAKGYGLANVELEAPARADTAYHICSITKFITAASILKLAEDGRLGLDDDLEGWVPGFSARERPVLIRHLLSHTSGLASYTSLPGFSEKERLDLGPQEVLGPVRDAPGHFAPGAGWRYCNTGFYLLGMIIEKVTGQACADHLRTQLFEPLGMSETRYGDVRPLIQNRASGYEIEQNELVNGPLMSWRAPYSGGGLISTALDLLKLMDGLARGRVLKPASLERMWSPTRLADGTAVDYGLGTRLGMLAGHRMLGHTGNGGGFRNALVLLPDDDLIVVVLSNTDAGSPTGVAASIARAILGVTAEPKIEHPLQAALPLPTAAATIQTRDGCRSSSATAASGSAPATTTPWARLFCMSETALLWHRTKATRRSEGS